MHRLCLMLFLFSVLQVQAHAQTADTTVGNPLAHSPFKTLSLDRLAANGHKESGIVDIIFTASNQSPRIASLAFSINPALSKAADDFDTVYHITQLRFGSTKRDSTDVVIVEIRPDQALHCGLYITGVPLNARYIRKVVLFTSLRLDDVPQGEDNIVLTNLPITWK
jgi:hypothetical protein